MSFSVFERFSKNKPVEFYEFRRGGQVWRYTSADVDVSYLGNVFLSTPIKRGDINFSGELAQANVRIKMPMNNPVAQAFSGFQVGLMASVTIYAQHRGQGDTVILTSGRFVNFRFTGAECELRFESDLTTQREQGLRRTASPGCPHTLYDSAPMSCGVVKALFKTTIVPVFVGGATLTDSAIAAFADGYFDGGLAEYRMPDGNIDARSIDDHVGGTITLRAPFSGLVAGIELDIYPGCDHSLQVCNDKFANVLNFGGLPFVPEANPYDGNPIF